VQTEILRERRAILCTRRPRSLGEQAPWMLHLMAVHGAEPGEASYETDRCASSAVREALALRWRWRARALSGAARGRCSTRSSPSAGACARSEQSATIDIVSGIAETRDLAVSLVEKYQDRHLADRVFDLAWTHSQVVLRSSTPPKPTRSCYARLASSVIYANASLRAERRAC
jgi:cyclic beta-1,2-glucan synthetase